MVPRGVNQQSRLWRGLPQQAEIVAMVTSGRKTAAEAALLFGVHPSTVYRLLMTYR
jgi:transposase-like protein